MEQRKLNSQDYPLATKRPQFIKTPTGKKLEDVTVENVLSGKIGPEDVRISPETLEMQAQIAESTNRDAIARNLRRAAELIAVPDYRILEMYNMLRPFRASKDDLLAVAEELEKEYNAKVNAYFVREAAEIYEKRGKLRQD